MEDWLEKMNDELEEFIKNHPIVEELADIIGKHVPPRQLTFMESVAQNAAVETVGKLFLQSANATYRQRLRKQNPANLPQYPGR